MLQRHHDMLWQRGHLGFEELAERRVRVVVAVAQVQIAGHQILPIQLLNKPSGSYSARTRSSLAMAASLAKRRTRTEVLVGELDADRQMRHRGHVGPRPVGVLRLVGRILPGAVERQVDVGFDAIGHVLTGRAWTPVQPEEVRRMRGSVSRIERIPGSRSSADADVHILSTA